MLFTSLQKSTSWVPFGRRSECFMASVPTGTLAFLRGLARRNHQPLSDLDQIRIRQRLFVRVEDLLVPVRVAQIGFRQLRERVAADHGVDAKDVRARRANVRDDLVLPILMGLDVVPETVGFELARLVILANASAFMMLSLLGRGPMASGC
jgi:hypothetical protein